MTKQNNILSWREVSKLLATFLCIGLLVVACKKKVDPLGVNGLPTGSELNSDVIDTFTLKTYSVKEDSIVTDNVSYSLLGSYNDPVFGTVDASFYTQLSISQSNPDFTGTIEVDSFILALNYGGYYGALDKQLVEVYELAESLSADSNYYHFSEKMVNSENLVPTDMDQGLISPYPQTSTVVGGDTLAPQLRIPLKKELAETFIAEAIGGTAFSSEDSFKEYFKGLYIKTNNTAQLAGEGGVLYFELPDSDTKLTIYYKQNGLVQKYDMLINAEEADFNRVVMDRSGTDVETVLNDTVSGQAEFYAQANGMRARVEFPTISSIPTNSIIQSARITFPVSYFEGDGAYPSTRLYVQFEGINAPPGQVTYDQDSKSYSFDLRSYIQSVLIGDFENKGLILSPAFFGSSAERIIFNGAQTLNKKKPTLSIIYTTY